jgi:indoleacetamide hydrolase
VRDLAHLSARDAARYVREGDVTAEAYAAALLHRHEGLKHLNCLITIRPSDVLERARAIDGARRRGERLGPLAGVPFVAKDQIEVAGYPTTLGTPALKDHVSRQDARVIETLYGSGAILLGKANLHELAAGGTSSNPTFGSVRNPYDPTRIPGGSSGGTAAAIAARIAPLGLGEDTGGSVRIPAGFCGVCGLRPSTWPRKRYPDAGLIPPPTPDDTQTVGPMARTVSDLELLDAAISRPEPVPSLSPSRIAIGVPREDFWDDEAIDKGVGATVKAAFERLQGAGFVLVPMDLHELIEIGNRLAGVVELGDPARFADWLSRHVPGLTWPRLLEQIASADVAAYYRGPRRIDPSLSAAERIERRERVVREYVDRLRAAGVAAIAFPEPPIPAPLIHAGGDPAALGLPGDDRQLLAVGRAVEAALGPLPPPPDPAGSDPHRAERLALESVPESVVSDRLQRAT